MSTKLTLADLVVLSLLIEAPRHGYEVAQELERRKVDEWASISRPQIYYSLRKLASSKHVLTVSEPDSASSGPERTVYRPSAEGRRALSAALSREDWMTTWLPQPFHTWLALSWKAPNKRAQLERRRSYLLERIEAERIDLAAIIEETSPTSDAADLVTLYIRQAEVEVDWIEKILIR